VLVGDIGAWRISPDHFVERNGLVIIIALGESIFAIGIGAAGIPLDGGVIAAALLGVAVAAALWWSYFDWMAYALKARLAEASGASRAALARDAYSYLHLPMVAGIVLFALGLKVILAHVEDPLTVVPAFGLCGGVAFYLLAHVAQRLRTGAGLGRGRPLAALLLLGLIPVAREVSALIALSLVAVVCSLLIVYEALRHREARAFIRSRRGVSLRKRPIALKKALNGAVVLDRGGSGHDHLLDRGVPCISSRASELRAPRSPDVSRCRGCASLRGSCAPQASSSIDQGHRRASMSIRTRRPNSPPQLSSHD
jgi:hypothetical protein